MAFEREWRDLAYIPRWSIVRVNRRQSVAEHSYYVVLYAVQIADLIGWRGDRDALVKYALCHDAPELETGDIASPVKDAINQMGDLKDFEADIYQRKFPGQPKWFTPEDPDIERIVKAADVLDAVMYICEESQMGNSTMGVFGYFPGGIGAPDWSDPAMGKSGKSIFNRNMHRLWKTWAALPEHRAEIWVDVLRRVNDAYHGVSKRLF